MAFLIENKDGKTRFIIAAILFRLETHLLDSKTTDLVLALALVVIKKKEENLGLYLRVIRRHSKYLTS